MSERASSDAAAAVRSVTLEVPDTGIAEAFHKAAFGPDVPVAVRAGEAPTDGFRGYTLSAVVPVPGAVDAIVEAALDAGATVVKPPAKSFWGYGGSLRGPDGAVWTVASSSKKDTGPATAPTVDSVVLLLGVTDVKAAKQFYVDRGLVVARGFGSRYVEFAASGGPVTVALQSRRALAKNAGVDPDGSGSHRLVISGDAGSFTDPDGFVWETSS